MVPGPPQCGHGNRSARLHPRRRRRGAASRSRLAHRRRRPAGAATSADGALRQPSYVRSAAGPSSSGSRSPSRRRPVPGDECEPPRTRGSGCRRGGCRRPMRAPRAAARRGGARPRTRRGATLKARTSASSCATGGTGRRAGRRVSAAPCPARRRRGGRRRRRGRRGSPPAGRPAITASAASRIGTAPLRPPNMMNSRSPGRSRASRSSGPVDERPDHERRAGGTAPSRRARRFPSRSRSRSMERPRAMNAVISARLGEPDA